MIPGIHSGPAYPSRWLSALSLDVVYRRQSHTTIERVGHARRHAPGSMKGRRWPRTLAEIASRLPQQADDLAQLAERDPAIVRGPGIGRLAPQAGQGGPVERPGLLDRLFLDAASQLVEAIDQGTRRSGTRPFDRDGPRPREACAVRRRDLIRSDSRLRQPCPSAMIPIVLLGRLLLLDFRRVGIDPGADPDDQTVMLSSPPRRLARLIR